MEDFGADDSVFFHTTHHRTGGGGGTTTVEKHVVAQNNAFDLKLRELRMLQPDLRHGELEKRREQVEAEQLGPEALSMRATQRMCELKTRTYSEDVQRVAVMEGQMPLDCWSAAKVKVAVLIHVDHMHARRMRILEGKYVPPAGSIFAGNKV